MVKKIKRKKIWICKLHKVKGKEGDICDVCVNQGG